MDSFYITVFTPTYNRAHTLHRVFESLKLQNFKDFEWLVVDDGSTDNTKEIIEYFRMSADFPIRYVYKENGGRHTAINMSYNHIRGRYVINVDSDDALTPNALTRIHEIWESIPDEDVDRYWCVSGRCIDSETRQMVGRPYPQDINSLTGVRKKVAAYKTKGEKSCCRKFEILKQYPFPVFSDTKFITENVVWEHMNDKYDQYCVNDIFRVYFQNEPDSLVKRHIHAETQLNSSYHAALIYINEFSHQWFYNKLIAFEYVNISRLSILTGRRFAQVVMETNAWYKRILVALGYPISRLYLTITKIF